jgi:hypothetical protein
MKIYTDVNIKLGDFEVDKESKIEDIYKLILKLWGKF